MCYPKYYSCGLQVETAGTPEHLASKTSKEMTVHWQKHRIVAAGAAALKLAFTAYDDELKRVEHFKYLGCIVSKDDNDVQDMCRNLKRMIKA